MKDIIRNIVKDYIISENKKHRLNEEKVDLGQINRMKDSIEKKLKKVYYNVTGNECNVPKIDIKIDDSIIDGKIAGFNHPKNGENGVMGIKSKALNDMEYLKWVITHELIHACVGKNLPKHKEHDGLFDRIADGMGLPKQYRD